MSASDQPRAITRRQLFRYAGGAAAVATVGGGMKLLQPSAVRQLVTGAGSHMSKPVADLFIGGTDGWISLPASPAIPPFHPDVYAPSGLTTYIFGFRNITDLDAADRIGQKNHAQHQAPLFWVKEFVPGTPGSPTEFDGEFVVDITNLGLAQRPDLFDAHTLHWHGFRNVIPFFDGEPTGSVSVPAGTVFRYVYRPRDPGTYMYHCHVEDVEHVHMGMTGIVFVRPKQDGNTSLYPSGKYLYNDGNGSTGFDREFVMFLTEVWAEAHWADAHIQLPEWSDYKPDFALLNGRVYPDTIAPPAPFPDTMPGTTTPFTVNAWLASGRTYMPAKVDDSGDLVAATGHDNLRYQPVSSLVNGNAGERVALRFANLGFREAAITITGLSMKVVGRDATPTLGRNATGVRKAGDAASVDTSYMTDTLSMGAGQSYDVIVTLPPFDPTHVSGTDASFGGASYNKYLLYNRAFLRSDNLANGDLGGQATEIRVFPAGTIPAQKLPNTSLAEQLNA